MVMIPSPPIWIRARITHWPKTVKAVPVSMTISPVTQTAEVAVNNASIQGMVWAVVEAGIFSRTVPERITRKKLNRISVAGFSFRMRLRRFIGLSLN